MSTLKIYGTFGPSCHTKDKIQAMLQYGMTGMRLNLSHVNLNDVKDWIKAFHEACKEEQVSAELLIDMQGPEIRLGRLETPVKLEKEAIVDLYSLPIPSCIIPYLKAKQQLLIDDGKICLEMINDTHAKVITEGMLQSSKSISLPGIDIKSPTLTNKDIENLRCCKQYGVTGIMQPFVRNKDDLIKVRETLHEFDLDTIKIFAKIENMQGVEQLESLIPYCDEIIIARGDLGNATTLPYLPSIQRKIENICNNYHKPYMVVTEMLNGMITKPTPTRAEVSDIYHAVYNGASSIMLTGEIAAGKYPVEAMKVFIDCASVALKDREK